MGWESTQALGQNPAQYAAYTAAATEAIFQTYNTVPGSAVRVAMTGVDSSGAFSGAGSGSPLDIDLGNFTSLQALFSQQPTVYSTAQSGYPASRWTANPNVAYTRPLALPLSSWYGAVPGGAGYQPFCHLQGVNVGALLILSVAIHAG